MENEIWKEHPEVPHRYKISNCGRVWSLISNKILKNQINSQGYYSVTLYLQEKQPTTHRVHKLVMLVFCGPPTTDKPVVNHIDGNKLNNHISNLEYTTYGLNNQHALDMGLRKVWNGINAVRGEQNHFASIQETDVYTIIKLRKERGWGARKIGKFLQISRSVIQHIISGRSWKHITKGGKI
jgi:hypothetical protein